MVSGRADVSWPSDQNGMSSSVIGSIGGSSALPALLRLLIGCGLTEFSMTPGAIPMARRVVQEMSVGEMAKVAAKVLTLPTVDEIERFLHDTFAPAAGARR